MAKLKPIAFRHKSQSGEQMSFSSEVTVDQDGTFNLTVPDELSETLGAISRDGRQNFHLTRPAKNLRVSAMSLAGASAAIEAAMRDHLACEVTRERVILYGTAMRIAYVVDDDGTIVPNGYFVKRRDPQAGTRWHGTLNANSRASHFTIGLTAHARDKVTYRRPKSVRVEYERIPDGEAHGAKLLNAFTSLDSAVRAGGDIKEMPYSEEAAAFFHDAMIAMCTLAHRIEGFFADPVELAKAIEAKAPMLGIAPPRGS